MHPPGLAFDVGRGEARLAGAADLFLSHGHLDHCLGVPFVLSHRTLHESKPTRVFCPAPVVEALSDLIAAAERLERVTYDFTIEGLSEEGRVGVGTDLTVEAFATSHVVPSLGYCLRRRRRRLADAYHGLPSGEIARLRAEGAEVSVEFEEPWIAYCGDTTVELLDRRPELYRVPILIVECTFLGEGMKGRGRRYGHVHLDDLAERAELFENEVVVLNHLSRRHRTSDLRRRVEERLGGLAERVVIVGESSRGRADG